MQIFYFINHFIGSIPLGTLYPLYFSTAITISTSLILAGVFCFKRLRGLKWSSVAICFISLYILLAVKIYCDFLLDTPPNLDVMPFSLILLCISVIEYGVILYLQPTKRELLPSEKRLIDQLLNEYDVLEDSALRDNFSQNPFRRIEYLSTQKGLDEKSFNDFNLNPSFVQNYVDKLLDKRLSSEDNEELTDIAKALEKYKLRNLSDFERNDFSTKLQRLLKLTAKYDTEDFDII